MTRRAMLIHGLSSNADTWWRVRAALEADGWEVTTPELRGHGAAPRAESYALAEYAADLPTGPWDLVVGHSLGGAVAVLVAGAAKRVVLLDPVLEVPPADWEAVKADQLAERELTIDTVRVQKPNWHPRDHELKVRAVQQVDPAAIERTFTDNPVWNVVAEASALDVPTLILSGDPAVYSMLSPETAEGIVAANRLVEYRVVAGAGHSVHRDKPDEAIAAIREWVA